jgi:ParB family chromosome partitioning protein
MKQPCLPNPTRIVDVTVRDRLRPLDEATVKSLTESIIRIGLQTPIAVRWLECADGSADCILVAGRHRLEACRRLGWETIPAFTFDDETEAQLWEIAENLHRAELTPEQRDEHIREWVRLRDAKGGIGPTLPNAQPHDKGTSAVARQLGVDRKTVREALTLGSLTDDAKEAARAAKLTRKEKLEVAKTDPQHQVAKVAEVVERKQVPGPAARQNLEDIDSRNTMLTSRASTSEDETPAEVVTATRVIPGEALEEDTADADDEAERRHESSALMKSASADGAKFRPEPQDDAAVWLVNTLRDALLDELLQHLDSAGHLTLAYAIRRLRATAEVPALDAWLIGQVIH